MAVEGDSKPKKSTSAKLDGEHKLVKKRKRIDNDSVAAVEAATAQQPPGPKPGAPISSAAEGATGSATAHKKRRGHKRDDEEQQPLDPQEAARRTRQRELRELAFKLRAEGKDYAPPKMASKKRGNEGDQPAGRQGGAGKGAKGPDGGKGKRYLGDKTPGWRPFDSVEVIVLPIYWNNNKEEKAAVLGASERARDILASAGLRVDMDASNKYTPGQKMKYWETMGVRVRVELGPRDVTNGNCVVALSTKAPGEVATKNVVNMRHKMLDAVRSALQKVKSGGQEDEEDEREEGKQQAKAEAKAQRGKAGNDGKQAAGKKKGQAAPDEEDEDNDDDDGENTGLGVSEKEEADVGGQKDGDDGGEEDVVAAAVAAVKSRQGGVLQRTSNPEARKVKQQRGRERDAGPGKAGDSSGGEDQKGGAVELPKVAGAKVPWSADALEDDFGDIVEFEAEEDKLTLSKKERLKKAVKQAKVKRKVERLAGTVDSDDLDGGGGDGGVMDRKGGAAAVQSKAGGKKRPKVVTF